MPIVGKDIKRPKEEPAKTREIKLVKARLVHPSTILPKRGRSREVIDSVKRDGIQQPIIVRPHPTIPNEYEVVDGDTRRFALVEKPDIRLYNDETEPEILVDIRYGLTDTEVFQLSNTMHKRKERNTYEQAESYVKWIEAKAKELGKEEGALTEVAKKLIDDDEPNSPTYPYTLNSKQSLLSQYVKVYGLFKKLETLEKNYPDKFKDIDLNALKPIGLNRLYTLTKPMDNPPVLIKAVEKLSKNPNMTLDRLKELTEREHITERKTPWSAIMRLSPDLSKNFHDALCKCNPQVFESSLTNNEILKRATQCLVKIFVNHPEDFEVELEKTKEGYKISAIWMRVPEPAQEIKKYREETAKEQEKQTDSPKKPIKIKLKEAKPHKIVLKEKKEPQISPDIEKIFESLLQKGLRTEGLTGTHERTEKPSVLIRRQGKIEKEIESRKLPHSGFRVIEMS